MGDSEKVYSKADVICNNGNSLLVKKAAVRGLFGTVMGR